MSRRDPIRAMCDSNIYDLIIEDEDVLTALKRDGSPVVMISTHIQRDEHAAISDEGKRDRIAQVPSAPIPTYGLVVDVSRIGEARITADSVDYDTILGNARPGKRSRDALIAMTAKEDADVLVTEDIDLQKRASKLNVTVWTWDTFRTAVLEAGAIRSRSTTLGLFSPFSRRIMCLRVVPTCSARRS